MDASTLGVIAGLVVFAIGVGGAVLPSLFAARSIRRQEKRDHGSTDGKPTTDALVEEVKNATSSGEQAGSGIAATQLELYNQHHARALTQSSQSFLLGAGAASLGFVVILASVAALALNPGDSAWLGTVSGVVCEAVAALFFTLAHATRNRADRMFERLNVQVDRLYLTKEAERLASALDEPAAKQVLADIAKRLVEAIPITAERTQMEPPTTV